MSYLNLQFVTQSLRNAYGPARRCLLGLFNVKIALSRFCRVGMWGGERGRAVGAPHSPAQPRGRPRIGFGSRPRRPRCSAAPRRLHKKLVGNINKVGGGAS